MLSWKILGSMSWRGSSNEAWSQQSVRARHWVRPFFLPCDGSSAGGCRSRVRSFAFYSYDAYGNPDERLSRETTKVPAALAAQIAERNVLRYAGYCYDEMSGLYYLSQRYYDPATACFISKDPARADGEESAYQYCAGDPVGSVDPTGEWGARVHSERTLRWARSAGFSSRQRNTIKDGNLDLDRNSATKGAWRRPWKTGKYHFGIFGAKGTGDALYRQAVTKWRRGERTSALFNLGRALHCRQDYYGHNGYRGSFVNHPKGIDDWDKAAEGFQNGVWRRNNTTATSRSTLKAFRKAVGLR